MCALYVEGKAEQRVTKLRLLTQCECAGTLKDECGLPFACVVQPFARVEEAPLSKPAIVRAQDIGRCRQCYACVQPSLLTVSCVSCAHASRHTCMCQPAERAAGMSTSTAASRRRGGAAACAAPTTSTGS